MFNEILFIELFDLADFQGQGLVKGQILHLRRQILSLRHAVPVQQDGNDVLSFEAQGIHNLLAEPVRLIGFLPQVGVRIIPVRNALGRERNALLGGPVVKPRTQRLLFQQDDDIRRVADVLQKLLVESSRAQFFPVKEHIIALLLKEFVQVCRRGA